MTDSNTQKIREEVARQLAPLFEQADREGLWFYCNYQDMWFSPDELRARQARGELHWGATNWKLRDPTELYRMKHESLQRAEKELNALALRIGPEAFARAMKEPK